MLSQIYNKVKGNFYTSKPIKKELFISLSTTYEETVQR